MTKFIMSRGKYYNGFRIPDIPTGTSMKVVTAYLFKPNSDRFAFNEIVNVSDTSDKKLNSTLNGKRLSKMSRSIYGPQKLHRKT